jgi:bifunctional non-homologous end joining protein LigD
VKAGGRPNLFSRRRNSFNGQYSLVFEALSGLPDNTVIDGEVFALNEAGRPDFNRLQHYRTEASRIHYFVFDLLVYNNRDLTQLPLIERHQIMKAVLKLESSRIRITYYFEASAEDMLSAARGQGLEGVVAKGRDSRYEAGKRSGSWAKYRLNSGQELVIGGYIPSAHGVDAIVVGYYRGEDLIYVARVRNGFVPASRCRVFARLKPLIVPKCPFANLLETHKGRWGEGLVYERTRMRPGLLKNLAAMVEDCCAFLRSTSLSFLNHLLGHADCPNSLTCLRSQPRIAAPWRTPTPSSARPSPTTA